MTLALVSDVAAAIAVGHCAGGVERMVLGGELKAVERINELALAARLGAGPGPIREAARALRPAGLLTFVLTQGVFMRQTDEREAKKIDHLRSDAFFVCKHLAEGLTAEQAQALEALLAEMHGAIEHADGSICHQLDLGFHDAIADFAGPGRATQTCDARIQKASLKSEHALLPPANDSRRKQAENRWNDLG